MAMGQISINHICTETKEKKQCLTILFWHCCHDLSFSKYFYHTFLLYFYYTYIVNINMASSSILYSIIILTYNIIYIRGSFNITMIIKIVTYTLTALLYRTI